MTSVFRFSSRSRGLLRQRLTAKRSFDCNYSAFGYISPQKAVSFAVNALLMYWRLVRRILWQRSIFYLFLTPFKDTKSKSIA
jgi:hypothetical protein